MLNRVAIFSRAVRDYEYRPSATLIEGNQIRGFRIVEYKRDTKVFSRTFRHFDVDVELVHSLGFLGLPETYYGLDQTTQLPLIECSGSLMTQEEIDQEINVFNIEDPYVVAYLLKHHLFQGYTLYEGQGYFGKDNYLVTLSSIKIYPTTKEVQFSVYYDIADQDEILGYFETFVLDPEAIHHARYHQEPSLHATISLDNLAEVVSTCGGNFTTTSVYQLPIVYIDPTDVEETKAKDTVFYSPALREVLWKRVASTKNSIHFEREVLPVLEQQLTDLNYIVT